MTTKITLDYDEVSGQLSDGMGILVSSMLGLTSVEPEHTGSTNTDDMIRLVNAGFTPKDVIELQKLEATK